MSESPIAEAMRVLREKGVVDRAIADNIVENHAWLVGMGELPELVRGERSAKLVPAPDTTGSNVAGISARQTVEMVPGEMPGPGGANLGSFGVLSGTLTVTGPDGNVLHLTEEELLDGEAAAGIETGKRRRKKG